MSGGWGPGAPDEEDLRDALERESGASADFSTEPGQTPSLEQESASEPADEPEQDESPGYQTILHEFEEAGGNSSEWRGGSVQAVLRSGEYGFLPVFGFNESNIAAKKYHQKYGIEVNGKEVDAPTEIGGRELSWWEDDSIMPKHPLVLVNPLGFSYIDPSVYDFRETFRFRKGEHFIFSDSGGYQLMSREEAEIVDDISEHNFYNLRVYPPRLLEWQVANADAGATIDYPPYNISGSSNFPDAVEHSADWVQFYQERRDKSTDMTYQMARRLRELRDAEDDQAQDYIFAPVIHGKPNPNGWPHKYVHGWHQAMEQAAEMVDIEPRGWVLKPEPASNFGQIALMLGYAAEYLDDAQFIHVLMVGGLVQKTLLMYYAMNSDQFVTSDASSYAAGGKRRQFDLPKTATRRSVIISSRDEDADDAAVDPNYLERYPCRCQVCSTVEGDVGFEFISEGSGSARSVALNLHNLHQVTMVERTLDALLREEDATIVETGGEPTGCEFWRYIRSMANDKRIDDLYRAMDYVRIALEDGLDEANNTYRIRWKKSGGKTIDRGQNSGADANW